MTPPVNCDKLCIYNMKPRATTKKAIYEKSTSNVITNGEKLKLFL